MADQPQVYALVDPRTGRTHYVGVSLHPKRRLYDHTHNPIASIRGWIESLDSVGVRPRLEILQEVPEGEDPVVHENRWIDKLFREGEPLVNVVGRKAWVAPRRATSPGDIGRRVQQMRKKLGLNQQELGRRAGTGGAQICTMESGRKPTVQYSIHTLAGIAIALGCSLDYLVWGGKRPELDLSKVKPRRRDGRLRVVNPFAERIHQRLGVLGITPAALAERLGVSRQAISQALHKHNGPSAATCLKIAEILGCGVTELLESESATAAE